VNIEDPPRGYSSPACSLHELGAAYRTYLTAPELLALLQELLEGEIAGARVCLQSGRDAAEPFASLLEQIHREEAHWCEMLGRQIRRLQGVPTTEAGAFCEKAMAIQDLRQRMALLNRGQAWVVRKLRDALPYIADETLKAELGGMLQAHAANIARVAAL
jgi:hypothetical protein